MSETNNEQDPFYSQENMEYLKKSVQELREGKGTKHELLEKNTERSSICDERSVLFWNVYREGS